MQYFHQASAQLIKFDTKFSVFLYFDGLNSDGSVSRPYSYSSFMKLSESSYRRHCYDNDDNF